MVHEVADQLPNMLLALIFVLSLIGMLALALSKMKSLPAFEQKHINVLSSLNLNQKQKLMLISVRDKVLLLGVSPNNISAISEIESKQTFQSQLELVKGVKND